MSEVLAQLEKKGGAMSETVLWSNPSPTSNFAYQTLTLNQSIDDFKEIAVYYRLSTANNSRESFVTYTTEEFKKFDMNSTNASGAIGVRAINTWVRSLFYTDSTHVIISSCYALSITDMDNHYTIPTKIVGLK